MYSIISRSYPIFGSKTKRNKQKSSKIGGLDENRAKPSKIGGLDENRAKTDKNLAK